MDEATFENLVKVMAFPAQDLAQMLGKFCATWLDQVDEVQAVAAQMMTSQSPQEHFDLMKRRLQTIAGGAALMGLQRISNPVNELEFSLQRSSMYSGVSGIPEGYWADFG